MALCECLRSREIDRFIDGEGFLVSDEGSEFDFDDYEPQDESSESDDIESYEDPQADEVPPSPPLQPVDFVLETIEEVVAGAGNLPHSVNDIIEL